MLRLRLRSGGANREAQLRGQLLVHSSGALTVDALEAARKAGALVASVHPVMSFPTQKIVPLQHVLFGVEARQPETKRKLYGLIRKIGGKPFSIQSAKKALYHAAGTLASPLLVSELSAAMATARLAGLSAQRSAEVGGSAGAGDGAERLRAWGGKEFQRPVCAWRCGDN